MYSEAEEQRVRAEKAREIAESKRAEAEAARAHSESNQGSGRVEHEEGREEAEELREFDSLGRKEAEEIRQKAEIERLRVHEEYIKELEALRDDPEHYMTPGAKKAFSKYRRDNILAYIVLAAAMVAGVWAFTKNAKDNLKNDINTFAKASCLASRQSDSPLNKFNNLIDLQIEANRDARKLNLERGDIARSKLNTENIIELQESRIPVPSERECQAPILP